MRYTVSVFKSGKSGPELVQVADIVCDRFTPVENPGGIAFVTDEHRFWSADKVTLVAYFPEKTERGPSWVVMEAN